MHVRDDYHRKPLKIDCLALKAKDKRVSSLNNVFAYI